MRWEALTSPEIARIDRVTPAVLSIAAVEQHGAHLTLATDAVIGAHFLDALDRQAGDEILILPQVKVGCSDHHMDFCGTLSVSHASFMAYVGDIISSVARHGFRNIVIFNSHGGNQAVGQVLLERLGAAHRDCRIAFFSWWRLAGPELAALRESGPGGIGHACEFESSVMMLAAPGDIRHNAIGGLSASPTFEWADGDLMIGSRGTLYRTMGERTNGTGVLGDASLASSEKGEAITAAVVRELLNVVRSLAQAGPKTEESP